MLAVHAYEQGLIHESDNQYKLSLAIQNHHETLGTDLPLTCPNKDMLEEFYHYIYNLVIAIPHIFNYRISTNLISLFLQSENTKTKHSRGVEALSPVTSEST